MNTHVAENAFVLVLKDGSLPDLLRKAAEEIEEQAQRRTYLAAATLSGMRRGELS